MGEGAAESAGNGADVGTDGGADVGTNDGVGGMFTSNLTVAFASVSERSASPATKGPSEMLVLSELGTLSKSAATFISSSNATDHD